MEVAPVFEISGAEEGSTEPFVPEYPLSDRLSDGALPRSGESIEPVDRGFVRVACTEFALIHGGPAGPLKATITVAMSVPGLFDMEEIIGYSRYCCRRRSGLRNLKQGSERFSNLGPNERGHFLGPHVDGDTHHRFESLIVGLRS